MTKIKQTALRANVLRIVSEYPITATDIAAKIGNECPRRIGSICNHLEREGALSRAGMVLAANWNRMPVWCLPGEESRYTGQLYEPKPVVVRAQLEWPDSLTAALLGDPTPGRSALDQRKATR